MKPFKMFLYGVERPTGANPVLNIQAQRGISTIAGSTTQATVSVTLNGDGTITYLGSGNPGTWHSDPAPGVGASFWAIVTINVGTIGTGTVGSRVPLTNGQTWTKTTSGTSSIRTAGAVGGIQIWDAATGGNKVAEGNFSITASVQATSTITTPSSSNGTVSDTAFVVNDAVPTQPV